MVTAKMGLIRRTKMFVVRRTDAGFRKVFERLVTFPYYLDPDAVENAEETAADGYDSLGY